MSLLVLCPSRGRPEKALECFDTFRRTVDRQTSSIIFVIDEDDPELDRYWANVPVHTVKPSGRRGMTGPVNTAISKYWNAYDTIGFVGDDHRFRTDGWDRIFIEHLKSVGGGLAYGNDLAWPNGEIPTQIFGSSGIWKALGWMCLPTADHLYLDNAWRVVGDGLQKLFYFPDVVIEHVHPAFGKAEWDEGYKAVNSSEMYSHDRAAFETWLSSGQAVEDVERVRSADR